MPYIRLSISQKLTQEKQEDVVRELGKAISVFPGKDERGLIVDLEDGKTIYVGGVKQDNMAFIDVRYYSNFPYQVKKEFTASVFEALNRVLGTSTERMSLTITEYNSWGGFGDFIDEYF